MSTPCPGGPEDPDGVLPAGWIRADCHLHTAASGDAVTTLDQLARRAAEARLDVVCITDHNVTSAAEAAAARGIGTRVIIGEEIRTAEGDIIGLFLTKRIPYVLPVAEVAEHFSLPGGAGSDAHDPAGVGAAVTVLPDFDGPASFLSSLAAARLAGEYRDHAPRYPAAARRLGRRLARGGPSGGPAARWPGRRAVR